MQDSTAKDALARWIACQLPACSIDELKVIAVRIHRMSRARDEYGALDLRKDRRDMILEAALETVDRGFYLDSQYVFEHDPAFADIREALAFDDEEPTATHARSINSTGKQCDDCSALPGCLHGSGCQWVTIVPVSGAV